MLWATGLSVEGRGLKVLILLDCLWAEIAWHSHIREQLTLRTYRQMVHHGVKCWAVWVQNLPGILSLHEWLCKITLNILPIIIRIIQVWKELVVLKDVDYLLGRQLLVLFRGPSFGSFVLDVPIVLIIRHEKIIRFHRYDRWLRWVVGPATTRELLHAVLIQSVNNLDTTLPTIWRATCVKLDHGLLFLNGL